MVRTVHLFKSCFLLFFVLSLLRHCAKDPISRSQTFQVAFHKSRCLALNVIVSIGGPKHSTRAFKWSWPPAVSKYSITTLRSCTAELITAHSSAFAPLNLYRFTISWWRFCENTTRKGICGDGEYHHSFQADSIFAERLMVNVAGITFNFSDMDNSKQH